MELEREKREWELGEKLRRRREILRLDEGWCGERKKKRGGGLKEGRGGVISAYPYDLF